MTLRLWIPVPRPPHHSNVQMLSGHDARCVSPTWPLPAILFCKWVVGVALRRTSCVIIIISSQFHQPTSQVRRGTCLHHFQHNCMHCNQSFASEKLEHRRVSGKPWAWPVMRSISRLLLWIARKILSMSMIVQQRYNGRGTYGFHNIIADTLPDIENNHTGGWNVEVENGRYHLQVYFAVLYLENGSYHLQVYFVFLRKFIWESNTENTLKGTLAENSTLQTPSWKVFIRNLIISLLSPNVGVSLQTESDAIPKQEQPWGRKVKVKTYKKEPIPIFKEELSKFKWAHLEKNLLNTWEMPLVQCKQLEQSDSSGTYWPVQF